MGNLFLGTLEGICEVVSTARSGSFFFKSMDQHYIIKALPSGRPPSLMRCSLCPCLTPTPSSPAQWRTSCCG